MIEGLADKVYKRDHLKCRHCESRNNLTPHHVVYRSQGGKDVMSNLLTLCFGCHSAHHAGKLNIEVRSLLEKDLVVTFDRQGKWIPT